jgi:hypothetical protein
LRLEQAGRFRNEYKVAIRAMIGLALIALAPLIYGELI